MSVQFVAITLAYISELFVIQWARIFCFSASLFLYFAVVALVYSFCSFLPKHCAQIQMSKNIYAFEVSGDSVSFIGRSSVVIWTIFPVVYLFNMLGFLPEQDYLLLGPILDVITKSLYFGTMHFGLARSEELKKDCLIEELKMQNVFQSKFLRFVYHEIRNPFNSIVLGLDYLATEVQLQQHFRTLTTLKKCATYLTRVMDDAVILSKNQGTLELLKEPVNIEDLVQDAIEELIVFAKAKEVSFKVNISKSFPDEVYADISKTKKLFQTLISNAVKFSPFGGIVKLSLEVEDVLPLKTVSFTFCVTDHGPGICDDVLPLLFEPFGLVRPGDFSEEEDRGSGLSLCLANHIANLMGAKISVSTKVGKGSVFSILLTFEICPSQVLRPSELKILCTQKSASHKPGFTEYSTPRTTGKRRNAMQQKPIQWKNLTRTFFPGDISDNFPPSTHKQLNQIYCYGPRLGMSQILQPHKKDTRFSRPLVQAALHLSVPKFLT